MKSNELTAAAGLEIEKHFKNRAVETPVIESELYTTLGRRLFEIYEKYKIERNDQREIERLSYLLTSFTIARDIPMKSKSFLGRLFGAGR